MGDVVHALPMVSDIARVYPHARIDWAVEEAFVDIARLHPAITHVLPLALRRWRRKLFSADSWRELLAARRSLRRTRYHTVIDCQGLLKSAVIASWARGPVTGFARDSAREPIATLLYQRKIAVARTLHAVDRNRQLAAGALDYALAGPEQFCVQARAQQLHAEPPFDEDGVVLLLSNASRASKLWPDENWVALEDALARQGRLSVLAWGTQAEQRACQGRVARMHSARVLPRASLAQLAALAARAALVVGLDTGLTHLCAALGAPTVGIFCDYDPALVGLRGGPRVASLGGVGQVPPVDAVLEAVARVLGTPAGPTPPETR